MNLQPTSQRNLIRFQESVDKEAELRRMKWLATGLLGLATIIFIVASLYEEQYVWVGFVQAAAEAAMVGAIADWFAVTALFRHPLGLKIPHTAILSRRKDSFGRSFGDFVQNNFLSAPVITARLRSMNIAQLVARWLDQPANSQAMTDFGALVLRGIVQVIKDEDVQELIEHGAVNWFQTVEITPIVGGVLGVVTSGDRQKELFKGGIKLAARLLEENKPVIRQRIAEETPWWVPQPVEDAIYQRVIDSLEETLRELEHNPEHPLHQRFDELLRNLVVDMQNSPEMINQGEAMKAEFLKDPAFQQFSVSLWLDIKQSLLERSPEERSTLQQTAQQAVMKLGRVLQDDEALQAKVNNWIEDGARYLIEAYGHEVGSLISNTISDWDAEAASYKVELQVGRDLQFIRINGTLVGGLVGLIIHGVTLLLS